MRTIVLKSFQCRPVLPWVLVLFVMGLLSACGQSLPEGRPPVQTVAANPDVTVLQSGDLSNVRTSLWGTWGGQAVRDAAVGFFGRPARAHALPAQHIPPHPFLADQGNNSMHGDSYAGKALDWPAPLGINPQVRSKSLGQFLGGECATLTFDAKGRLMSVCATILSFKLYLLDANSLEPLAQYELPLRHSNKTLQMRKIMTDTSGGAYHHLLAGDRPLIADADNVLRIFTVDDSAVQPMWQAQKEAGVLGSGVDAVPAATPVAAPVWKVQKEWDLNPALPAHQQVTDAMPDWQGRYWFVTRQGVVGVLNPETGTIKTTALKGEEIENSFSVAEDGVYIVTDAALYRFEADAAGQPRWTWREVYENHRKPKPGVIGLGSGTTPTLLGKDFITITDNADPQMHVVVYRRQPDWKGQREVCQVPVFTPNRSVTDNGMIGYRNSIIVTNNYGYDKPTRPVWTEGGVTRIDINPDGKGCRVVWNSPEAAQTVVPKLSTKTGLIYLYTREPVPGFDAQKDAAYAWYLTAVDYATGATRFKVLTGTGLNYNNNWAPITLSPWGTAYVGVLGGLVAVKDGPPDGDITPQPPHKKEAASKESASKESASKAHGAHTAHGER